LDCVLARRFSQNPNGQPSLHGDVLFRGLRVVFQCVWRQPKLRNALCSQAYAPLSPTESKLPLFPAKREMCRFNSMAFSVSACDDDES
jgi:hypothetical protein